VRFGIDLGGTKIEGIVIDAAGRERARHRLATPSSTYESVVGAIAAVVDQLESMAGSGRATRVGIATPGFLAPSEGVIRNSNLAPLNGRPLDRDLARVLGREVRIANDANCFVLSETADGAAARPPGEPAIAGDDDDVVFGATLGTGVGGGFVLGGRVWPGRNGSAGEWSHLTLPFLTPADGDGAGCYCARPGCVESFLKGQSIEADHARITGETHTSREIASRADAGNPAAIATMNRYADRLARALSMIVNLIDPRVIVLGGGVSNNARIFASLPDMLGQYTVSPSVKTPVVQAMHGDASGVRGAAWLWPDAAPPP
jgi:fructokinase